MSRRKTVVVAIGGSFMFGPRVIKGIMDYSARLDPPWEINFDNDALFSFGRSNGTAKEFSQLREVVERTSAKGVITYVRSQRLATSLGELGVPIVNVASCTPLQAPNLWHVMVNNRAIGEMAANYFLGNGYRNFAFFGTLDTWHSRQRQEGFLAVLSQAGLSADVYNLRYSHQMGQADIGAWLRTLPRPVALMCGQDPLGRDALSACDREGLHTPNDIAIVSAGNDYFFCTGGAVSLSSVDMAVERVGYEAASVLDRRLRHVPVEPTTLVNPAMVVVRQSSDAIAVDDPEVASAVRFIRAHAADRIGVKNVLAEVPVSRRSLERRFFQKTGRTLRKEICRAHLELAKKLLIDTDLTITAVAQKSGFARPEVFFAVFKREVAQTPLAYRKKFRRGMSEFDSLNGATKPR